jgi:hypothetical protein
MRRVLPALLLLAGLLLAACSDEVTPPAQGYTLSAPTLAPSPVVDVLGVASPAPTPVAGINDPTYAALPSGGELPLLPAGDANLSAVSNPIHVTAMDGALLDGDLYTHVNDDTRYPAALLVHTDRTAWGDFPQRLRDGGFTVLSMNLRPERAVDDLLAMVAAFGQMNLVDPSRILLIGADDSAGGALGGCVAGVPMDALALLSPASVPAGAALQCSKPLLLVAAPSHPSYAAVHAIQAETRSPITVLDAVGGGSGPALVANDPALAAQVIGWAQAQVGA